MPALAGKRDEKLAMNNKRGPIWGNCMVMCPRCDGDGKIECPHCEGSGYEPDDNDDISIGGWVEAGVDAVDDVVVGPEKCSECNGKKEIDCPECDGTGET